MAITITHATQIAGANDPSYQVSKDVWNEGHTLNLSGPALIGKPDAGSGSASEVSLAGGLAFAGSALRLNTIDLAAAGKFVVDHTVADGSSAVYCLMDTANAFSTAGAAWILGKSAGTSRWAIAWSAGNAVAFKTYSNGRLDFDAGSGDIFFTGGRNFIQAYTSINRTGDASSTATQKDSKVLAFQGQTYSGSAGENRYVYQKFVASTTVNREHGWCLFLNDTSGNGTGGSEVFRAWWNVAGAKPFFGFWTNAPTQVVDINDDSVRVRTSKTPASASATGNAGQVCWDANYLYVCTATNTWKRTALATW